MFTLTACLECLARRARQRQQLWRPSWVFSWCSHRRIMEGADAETYAMLLQLKELRCARLQVALARTRSRSVVGAHHRRVSSASQRSTPIPQLTRGCVVLACVHLPGDDPRGGKHLDAVLTLFDLSVRALAAEGLDDLVKCKSRSRCA